MSRRVGMQELAELEIFRGCTRRELRTIDALGTPLPLRAGRLVCEERRPGREVFVVLDGRADVSIGGTHLRSLGKGEVFGEMSLLHASARRATVTAATDLEVLVLDPGEFSTLLARVPGLAKRLRALARTRLADEQGLTRPS